MSTSEAYGVYCSKPGVYEVVWAQKESPESTTLTMKSAQLFTRRLPGQLTTKEGKPVASVDEFVKAQVGRELISYNQAGDAHG
jgi:hypothetical protein